MRGAPRQAAPLAAIIALLATSGGSPPPLAAQAAPVTEARQALFQGDLDRAGDLLRPLTRRPEPGSAPALRLHARALAEAGAYDDALDLLERAPDPDRPRVARLRGDLLRQLGRWDEAEAAYREAVDARVADAELARLELAELSLLRGRTDEARRAFDSFIDVYNGNGALNGETLLAVARAVIHLGRGEPALYQDALRALDEAADALPDGDPRPVVAAGDLFLARYASPDAYDEYRRVLERNPRQPDALLGRARAQHFDGSPEALATVEAALEVNPNLVGARVLAARIHLRAEDLEAAAREAEAALEVNPRSLEALAVRAAVHHLAGEMADYRHTLARADALNPVYSGLHTTLAQVSADHRKYAEAVRFAAEATRRDPQDWEALGVLATNQLRTGAMEEGRANMERAFQGDPYNPWFKNTLDLLDTFPRYEVVETDHFQILLHGSEAGVLAPYVTRMAEEAFDAMVERYGAAPPTPVRLEVFPSHADFSVRTLGMVGMGALGVSFGSTLVMDSPSARDPGSFNWASTLWHELAHAFHLGISEHEVPRWFSEGLAVREQRVARGRWGHRPDPAFLTAWHDGMMPPLSRMNEGFVRPQFPQQVIFSYIQASLAFDWIEGEFGFPAIRRFLDGYRVGRGTDELAREILGMDADELDAAFDAYMRQRFEGELKAVAAIPGVGRDGRLGGGDTVGDSDLASLRRRAREMPGSFQARLALGNALEGAGEDREAVEHLRAALTLFPEYPGPDGPLAALARIHERRGELEQAANALNRLGALNESAYTAYLDEARLRRELGQPGAERVALERALEVYPFEVDPHLRLADLYREAGDVDGVVREREAVLALDPVDRADAHFRLAQALVAAGRPDDARTQLLRALEIAPSFDAALDLLLELREGTR